MDKMKAMKQEMNVVSAVILVLALVCAMMGPGFAVREASATTLVNVNDVRARENAIPGEAGRLRGEKADIRRKLRARVGTSDQRKAWRARNMEIFRRLGELKRELRKVRKCRKALEYAAKQGFPYPELIPGESVEDLEKRFLDYIRSTLFRLENINRAIRAARESGRQADGIRRNLQKRKALLEELLRKARADRRKIQNGEIVIPPAPQNNGGGNAGAGNGNGENQGGNGNGENEENENENVQYFPGEGYFVNLATDQIRIGLDKETPVYAVHNPFDGALLVQVEITDDESNSLAYMEFSLAPGSSLDVSSIMGQLDDVNAATVIYFLSELI